MARLGRGSSNLPGRTLRSPARERVSYSQGHRGCVSVSEPWQRVRFCRTSERLTERERSRLCALFEHEPVIAEAWGLKEAFRSIYRAQERREAERRLERFLAAAERAQLPAFKDFADGVRLWR